MIDGQGAVRAGALAGLLFLAGCTASAEGLSRGFEVPQQGRVVDLTHVFRSGQAEPTRLLAPAAFGEGATTVDRLGTGRLVAPLVVIDVREDVAAMSDLELTVEQVEFFEDVHGEVPLGAIVLLRSGWSERWGRPDHYINADGEGRPRHPGFSPAAVDYLVQQRGVVGLGTEAPALSSRRPEEVSLRMAAADRYAVVNLDGLDLLPETGALGCVAPLRLEGALLAPARFLAIVPRSLASR